MLPTANPTLLSSIVNTKLRDTYPSLDALCEDMDVSVDELNAILNASGFAYDPKLNQYK